MTLKTVVELLDAQVITEGEGLETEVLSAFGCDLMSDVLAFVKNQAMLLTGLVNLQVVRTAEMMDMKAIVFVRGKKPSEDIIKLAKDMKMAILTTDLTLYLSSGKLYSNGLGN